MVEREGKDNVVVLLGSPDPDSTEIFAETVTKGDPTFAGPLAGVDLGLPVFHVLETEVSEGADQAVYEEQVGLMAGALDAEQIIEAMRRVRASNGAA